jgi:SAM-dependent MidA family methyltransferase
VGEPLNRIRREIDDEGPITFARFMELALYGPGGFYEHPPVGTDRHFVTNPHVHPVFGELLARAVRDLWEALGMPRPFRMTEVGAGDGTLARSLLANTGAIPVRYTAVERSPGALEALAELEEVRATDRLAAPADLVLANELLDNLPFRIVERTVDGWSEVRIGVEGATFEEDLVRASADLALEADLVAASPVPVGARLPVPTGVREWLQACGFVLRSGVLVVVDYAATAAELVERGQDGWLRTYRAHERGASPLVAPGEQDITADVPLEYLVHAAGRVGLSLELECTQAEWLRELGIDDLVAEARAQWDARAHVGDLEALRHRSRVNEAAALRDPGGLGAHRVLVFRAS